MCGGLGAAGDVRRLGWTAAVCNCEAVVVVEFQK